MSVSNSDSSTDEEQKDPSFAMKWERISDVPVASFHGIGTQPTYDSYNSFALPSSVDNSSSEQSCNLSDQSCNSKGDHDKNIATSNQVREIEILTDHTSRPENTRKCERSNKLQCRCQLHHEKSRDTFCGIKCSECCKEQLVKDSDIGKKIDLKLTYNVVKDQATPFIKESCAFHSGESTKDHNN